MDSNEAVMENENNTNLESQSHMHMDQHLIDSGTLETEREDTQDSRNDKVNDQEYIDHGTVVNSLDPQSESAIEPFTTNAASTTTLPIPDNVVSQETAHVMDIEASMDIEGSVDCALPIGASSIAAIEMESASELVTSETAVKKDTEVAVEVNASYGTAPDRDNLLKTSAENTEVDKMDHSSEAVTDNVPSEDPTQMQDSSGAATDLVTLETDVFSDTPAVLVTDSEAGVSGECTAVKETPTNVEDTSPENGTVNNVAPKSDVSESNVIIEGSMEKCPDASAKLDPESKSSSSIAVSSDNTPKVDSIVENSGDTKNVEEIKLLEESMDCEDEGNVKKTEESGASSNKAVDVGNVSQSGSIEPNKKSGDLSKEEIMDVDSSIDKNEKNDQSLPLDDAGSAVDSHHGDTNVNGSEGKNGSNASKNGLDTENQSTVNKIECSTNNSENDTIKKDSFDKSSSSSPDTSNWVQKDPVNEKGEESEDNKKFDSKDESESQKKLDLGQSNVADEKKKDNPDSAKSKESEDDVVCLDDDDASASASNGHNSETSSISSQQNEEPTVNGHQVPKKTSADSAPAAGTEKSKKKSSKNKTQTCIVCKKVIRCKYNIVRNGDVKHLCDDACFKKFRTSPNLFLKSEKEKAAENSQPDQQLKNAEPTPPPPVNNSARSIKEIAKTTPEPPKATKEPVKSFKEIIAKPSPTPTPTRPYNRSNRTNATANQTNKAGIKTCAVCQLINVNQFPFCNWQGLDFCGEACLGKFQTNLSSSCSNCNHVVPIELRTSLCMKVGNEVRTFCKSQCYTDFRSRLKLCGFCQKSLEGVVGSFIAPIGDGKFKDFCSKVCKKKLEQQLKDVEITKEDAIASNRHANIPCSVCQKVVPMKHQVRIGSKTSNLCSNLCLSAFQYSNKIDMAKCDSCGCLCTAEEAKAHFIHFEGQVRRFCSDTCVSKFRVTHSKMVPCTWCANSKPNFDMIERQDGENKCQLFCSLNCLSLYRVNLQAKSNQAVSCDQCKKVVPAQYHLTMSDASVRNFCCYSCVMAFQSQFTAKPQAGTLGPSPLVHNTPQKQPPRQPQQQTPQPQQLQTGNRRSRMNTRGVAAKQPPAVQSPPQSALPVISSVVSLAQPPPQTPPANAAAPVAQVNQGTDPRSADGKDRIIVQEPAAKVLRNKQVHCKPVTQTKATSCRPHSQPKETQTDKIEPEKKTVFVPVPVPIYIPMPTVMYTAPTPLLLPIPIPIPVPMFIPTTRKSANGIMRTIKDIVNRIPADPLEAELLAMAEAAVATDSKQPGDSDTDEEGDYYGDEDMGDDDSAAIDGKKSGDGEDMLEMALRMAEEMSAPIQDLETSVDAVAVKNDPPPQPPKPEPVVPQYNNYRGRQNNRDEDFMPSPRRGRGAKRGARGRPPGSGGRPKRQRVERNYAEMEDAVSSIVEAKPPAPPKPPEPPADANYRLKFTYGVNAWQHWVISKNTEIEKSLASSGGRGNRTFPTDILKTTTDQLNFSLCMFIKEVRKPNGEEYSPDSVYYLCLGIQQYLYENGRIDNIFTDLTFEKFTNSLHDVLKTLKPKVNTHGQTLCRIEEEHLWESKQLGAHSPNVLLNTLIYFHTKHFILKTDVEHMSLSFAQIVKHLKKGVPGSKQSKNIALRYYCLSKNKDNFPRKSKEGVPVYEVTENFENPLRCPVKLYEFFLSKCPESIKNRHDIFYPVPERSCVPDSPVWYSTQAIDQHTMDKMLKRTLLVREIQESHLHAQPMYL